MSGVVSAASRLAVVSSASPRGCAIQGVAQAHDAAEDAPQDGQDDGIADERDEGVREGWPLAAGADRHDRGEDEEHEEDLSDVDDGEAVELRRPEDARRRARSRACQPRSRP